MASDTFGTTFFGLLGPESFSEVSGVLFGFGAGPWLGMVDVERIETAKSLSAMLVVEELGDWAGVSCFMVVFRLFLNRCRLVSSAAASSIW